MEKGVDVNTKDETERTALHVAAEGGHKLVARLLVEKGADIHAKNICGRTALYLAAGGGYKAVVRLYFFLSIVLYYVQYCAYSL